ncbi:hypothetical protein Hanom_Chr13g01229071 [Helianthus anomalus]
MPFSSLRLGQFCDFRSKVCFSVFGSKKFKLLPFSSSSLTPSIFSPLSQGYFRLFVNFRFFSLYVQAFSIMFKYSKYPY